MSALTAGTAAALPPHLRGKKKKMQHGLHSLQDLGHDIADLGHDIAHASGAMHLALDARAIEKEVLHSSKVRPHSGHIAPLAPLGPAFPSARRPVAAPLPPLPRRPQ